MVLVLCLNAAVDKTARVRKFVSHGLNRLEDSLSLPGGKGVNVARALKRMGEKPVLLGFTAGYTGDFIERACREEGLDARWIRLASGESRTCLSILDGGPAPTEANEPGPVVGRADLARLEREYRRLLDGCRLAVLSGSLPAGCPDDAYARLIELARRRGRRAFVDTSGAPLQAALSARPDWVKVNADEAAAVGPDPRRRPLEALRRLGENGAITLGPAGAVALFEGAVALRAVPPRVRVATPVGSGDTFLAGLAHSLLRGEGPIRSLAYATSVATASCRVLGAGVFRPKDALGILRRVRVSELAA